MERMRKKSILKATEHSTQSAILDYLTLVGVFHYRNNSGAMAGEYKGKKWFMRFGAVGSPDIVAVVDGRYIGIEVKGTGGKQSEAQKQFQEKLEKAGGRYILAYSLEDIQIPLLVEGMRF
jgi:hypothetical protein